jgi:hypothetical protein
LNRTHSFLQVVAALQQAGFEPLVMGGHAIRYYGVGRNTVDFDFHLPLESARSLESRLLQTERESDWQDVALLEEILDLRRLAQANDDAGKLAFVSGLRSRRGFERALAKGLFADATLIRRALGQAASIMTQAFLLPFVTDAGVTVACAEAAWQFLDGPLRRVAPGSARHLALVEAARRMHKQAAMAADRADKEQR